MDPAWSIALGDLTSPRSCKGNKSGENLADDWDSTDGATLREKRRDLGSNLKCRLDTNLAKTIVAMDPARIRSMLVACLQGVIVEALADGVGS